MSSTKRSGESTVTFGSSCTYPNPSARPTMKKVMKVLEGKVEVMLNPRIWKPICSKRCKTLSVGLGIHRVLGFGSHPTFEDILSSHCTSSMSLSWSNAIMDGR